MTIVYACLLLVKRNYKPCSVACHPVMLSSIPVIKLLSVLCDAQAPLADAALSVFMEWPSGNSRALQDAYQMSTDTCSIQ